MIDRMAAALVALAGVVWATATTAATAATAAPLTAEALRAALAPKLLAQAERNPAAFARKLDTLTKAYGKDGALGPDGIDRMGTVVRAKIRADEVARLLGADLDGDGQVTEPERAELVATLSPGRLKRFTALWDTADADRSGGVTAAEATTSATAAANKAMGPERLAEWKTLMVMDANADGRLTGDEAVAALALLGPMEPAATGAVSGSGPCGKPETTAEGDGSAASG